ncbi:cytochrome P450 [Lactarius pseudohatsudake]|nr:cytochrome P450 [Lactarius pseudohatsudake]
MFIPKGTLCLTNLWRNCHHDPSTYGDDAAMFQPERFLDASSEIISGPAETREEGHSMFGFGRRACMGKPIAEELLFVATALWATTLERVRGENGTEVPALHVLGKRETRKRFDQLRSLLRPLSRSARQPESQLTRQDTTSYGARLGSCLL